MQGMAPTESVGTGFLPGLSIDEGGTGCFDHSKIVRPIAQTPALAGVQEESMVVVLDPDPLQYIGYGLGRGDGQDFGLSRENTLRNVHRSWKGGSISIGHMRSANIIKGGSKWIIM